MSEVTVKIFKGVGIDNQILSDSQVSAFEQAYPVIACRGFQVSSAYILFVTPNQDEQPPEIFGIEWNEQVPANDAPLGSGRVL